MVVIVSLARIHVGRCSHSVTQADFNEAAQTIQNRLSLYYHASVWLAMTRRRKRPINIYFDIYCEFPKSASRYPCFENELNIIFLDFRSDM